MKARVSSGSIWHHARWTSADWPESTTLGGTGPTEEHILVVYAEIPYMSNATLYPVQVEDEDGIMFGWGRLNAKFDGETWLTIAGEMTRPSSPEEESALVKRTVSHDWRYA